MSFLSTILALLPDNVSKKIKPVHLRTSFEYVYEDMENMSATFPPGENGQIYEIDNDLPEKIKPTDRLTENELAAASALTTLSGVLEELADIEQNKANKDASEMSSANIISWQEALAINDLSDNLQDAIIALQNADIAESNARTFADGVLDSKITAEKNRNDSQDSAIADLNVHNITITTSSSITTNTLSTINYFNQNGRNVILSNGVNAINLTCEITSDSKFVASYTKLGSAAITFTAGSGATLVQVDGTAILNGAVGSTACLTRSGNTFYLQISNR